MGRTRRWGVIESIRSSGGPSLRPAFPARLGTRFPHAWIKISGERRSTLDLFSGTVTVVGGPAASPGCTLRADVDFQFADEAVNWRGLTGGEDDLAVEVRPDGFVASRR